MIRASKEVHDDAMWLLNEGFHLVWEVKMGFTEDLIEMTCGRKAGVNRGNRKRKQQQPV